MSSLKDGPNVPCVVCKWRTVKSFVKDYVVCEHCFHITKGDPVQKFSDAKFQFNKGGYVDYVLEKVNRIDWNERLYVNVLVINDTDNTLVDMVSDTILTQVSKYRLKTVCLSPLYNGSFFSRHRHNKFVLSDYICSSLAEEYGTFDLILLNDTLTYCKNPRDVLQSCKRLSNRDTLIISINLYTSIFASMDLLMTSKDVNNVFNTNSLKRLCNSCDLRLNKSMIYDNTWIISEIEYGPEIRVSSQVAATLYKEMTVPIYDVDVYKKLATYWKVYLEGLNDIIRRYRLIGYTILLVNDLPEDRSNGYIEYEREIHNERSIKTNDKTLVVVCNKNNKNIQGRLDSLGSGSNKTNDIFLDLYHLIGYV